jgi:adenylate kinase family enzyme
VVNLVFDLEALGKRICIIGPSNAGKSTLAKALGEKLDIPHYHLDQLAHIPGTNWVRRPDPDFVADNDKIIMSDAWVIDGNYSVCIPQRFARATCIIWIDPPLLGSVWRYILPSFQSTHNRAGRLAGATRGFNWSLVHYTLTQYPKKRSDYARFIASASHAHYLHISSFQELKKLYTQWSLSR